MKEKLSNRLPISLKLFIKLFIYRSVAAPSRLVARLAKLVRRGQLNVTTHSLNTPDLAQYSASDFLLLKEAIAGRKDGIPAPDRPVRTSIILLCYNKIELTVQCLCSLLHEVDLSDTEIVVVNNASTDETHRVLSDVDGYIRLINLDVNVGCVGGNNEGARYARGKYLVFLNNDTVVLPGWLEPLVETAEEDPNVGAVGSMFIYPDGTLQEAGGIVWQTGEAYHYGWGKSPEDRLFNFAREVDYCTSASLLVRKELFNGLGAFDRIYSPISYEDVDICMGVRSLGYKVIFQPSSRIIHFEGATVGTDTRFGLKRFQVINRQKFQEKWHEVLEREHLPKNLKELTEASNRKRNWPRVVVFDERVPSPDRDAGSLRMFLILKTLAKWCHVIFVPFNRPQSLDYERALWKEGIETADAIDYRRLLQNKNVKLAIVSRPSMAEALIHRIRRANPSVKIVFDMVDTHFIRFQREHEISGDAYALAEAQRYRKLERRLAQASDLVWSASSEDKRVMESEVPGRKIEVVPTIHELRDGGKSFAERGDLLFIGNLAHRPNEDAVLFFMREVYPRLRQTLPNVRLDIIGDNPSPDIVACNSEMVRVRGYVPDVEPYLRERRVFVAPLRFGAGIKGKVGEAMAHSIPVVTTTIGAEGFGLTHGVDVMIADDPKSFAAAVEQLYTHQELWERVAHNSRLRIEEHFTPEVIAETINNSIREVSKT
ncbi:MAG TPA: glycosyltransferase [Pyrinomonadaceae bacterium]|nr:glycosyltransferase [Pyrinomonadaceae bacterium]